MKVLRASVFVLMLTVLLSFVGGEVAFSATKKPVVPVKVVVSKVVQKPAPKVVVKKVKKVVVKKKSKNGTSKLLCTTNCPLVTPH